jgi:hypothetical protein
MLAKRSAQTQFGRHYPREATMRFVMLLVLLTLPVAAAADASFRIVGPAGPDIVRYLATTTVDCIDSDRKDCTISSIMSDAETFYGKFPGDTSDYVVAFVLTRTGGSSDNMMAVVLKGDTLGTYSLVGTAANIYGADPREVRFGAGRTITWIGTVMAPSDFHAQATGKKKLGLIVAEKAVRFLDK